MTEPLPTARWCEQAASWPQQGRHVLALHDEDTVVVYQAYRPDIAEYTVTHQRFGGSFRLGRMSWIKPGFLWMMYRCGWATKPGQERVLAVRLTRAGFDAVLESAVPASHDPARYPDRSSWQHAVRTSQVRVQWDPDHDPHGHPLPRRAIQLGLRGEILAAYAHDWPVEILDLTDFVTAQQAVLREQGTNALRTPPRDPIPLGDPRCGLRNAWPPPARRTRQRR